MKISASRTEMEELGVRGKAINTKILNLNESKLSLDKSELISIFIICRDFFHPPSDQESGKDKLVFKLEENPLYFLVEDEFVKIGLDFEFEWTNKFIEIPISTLSYEQDDYGTLAWVVEANYQSSKGNLGFKIPIRQLGKNYLINNMSIELPDNVELTMYTPHNNKR